MAIFSSFFLILQSGYTQVQVAWPCIIPKKNYLATYILVTLEEF